jgi:hypothetical protein
VIARKKDSKKIQKSIVKLENDSTFAAALNARHESKEKKIPLRRVQKTFEHFFCESKNGSNFASRFVQNIF